MWNLHGVVQGYGWGSPHAIPEFLGIRPDGRTYAEVWFGAHPGGAATVVPTAPRWAHPGADGGARRLDDLVSSDPRTVLGERVRDAFGARLPYLVKLLAAAQALSLQVHPDAEQAAAGYARETAARLSDDCRSYRDDRHKPETLVALGAVRALVGFRDPDAIADDLERIGSDAVVDVVAALHAAGTADARIGHAFARLLRLSPHDRRAALQALVGMAGGTSTGPWGHDALEVAREVLVAHPDDVGALGTVFLNTVELEPGEALSVGAGVVHCYVHGFGLEIMASSDNVLRAGLTTKRVDVDELLAVVRFAPGPPDVRRATASHPSPGVTVGRYDLPFGEYALDVVDLDGAEPWVCPGSSGPRLLLGLIGAATVGAPTGRVALAPGEAALVADGEVATLSGVGRVALVSVPGSTQSGH